MRYILVTQKSIHIELYKNKFIFCILEKQSKWKLKYKVTCYLLSSLIGILSGDREIFTNK